MDALSSQLMLESLFTPKSIYGNELAAVRSLQINTFQQLPVSVWDCILDIQNSPKFLNKEAAEAYRNEGNKYFKSQETLGKAVLMYTRAIYTAPQGSSSLAFAHGNRAAALYKMGEFEAAYFDCECALELDHPKVNVILLRQATIARTLKDSSKLKHCIEQLEGLLLDEKMCAKFKENLDELVISTESTENATGLSNSSAGEKIKIVSKGKQRRHIVTDQTIAKDEVILEEELFAFVPVDEGYRYWILKHSDENFEFICDGCFESDIVPFPCYACRAVFYCSRRCREKHAVIHGLECTGYKGELFIESRRTQLALRCLLKCFEEILSKVKELCSGKKCRTAEELWPIMLRACKGWSIFGLFSDFVHFQKRCPVIVEVCKTSAYCYYLAKETNFFDKSQHARFSLMESEAEWKCLVNAMLLHICCKLSYHARQVERLSAISTFSGINNSVAKAGDMSKSLALGVKIEAVYVLNSLCLHSCDPNSYYSFRKSKTQLRAGKAFSRGEVVTVSYVYNKHPYHIRREKLLRDFGFTCHCNKCKKADDSQYVIFHRIVCMACGATYTPEIDVVCPKCKRVYDPIFYESIIRNSMQMEDSVAKYMFLYKEFRRMRSFLPKNTFIRGNSVFAILTSFLKVEDHSIKYNRKLNSLMIEVAVDLLERVETGAGIDNQPLFVMSGSNLMDLLAIRREQGYGDLAISYDLSKIKQSFQTVDGKARVLLEKYFEKFIA